jgi:ABC-type transport system involved in cytochrome c biogenesis permease subunit
MDPRNALNELYGKIGITALLIGILALDRTRSPLGNVLAALAVAVVAVLALYLISVAQRRPVRTHKGVAYTLAIVALLGLLGSAAFGQ